MACWRHVFPSNIQQTLVEEGNDRPLSLIISRLEISALQQPCVPQLMKRNTFTRAMVPELLIHEARFPKTGTNTPHADLITLAFLQN